MSCMDNKDGSCSVEYIPYEAGTYSLNVTYGGHQVPGEEAGRLGLGWSHHLPSTLSHTQSIPLPPTQAVLSKCLCMM